jgi:hypothetical protein
MSNKHIIVDLETLDTKPSAAITSMTFIVFDPSDIKPFEELHQNSLNIKLDWMHQINTLKRTTSESTLDFWRKPENKQAFDECVKPRPDDVKLTEVHNIIHKYITEQGFDPLQNGNFIYSRGNVFDMGMLENVFESLGQQNPFPFWGYRDVRTEVDAIMQHIDDSHEFNGYVRGLEFDGMIKHNSAHDCARDILHIQYAHYKLCGLIEEK